MRILTGVPWGKGIKRQWVVDDGNFQRFRWHFFRILGCCHRTRLPMLGSIRAGTLSYSTVKLFSKYYNYVITVPKRYSGTDRRTR